MKDLTAKLSRLSADLAELEQELRRLAPAKGNKPTKKFCDEAVLAEIKNAVDSVRHLLWPHVEEFARQNEGVDTAIQRYRMQRVTEMLHDLKDRVAEPAVAAMPEAKSFFASIQEIATTAVERHLERAAVVPKKRPTAEYTVRELKQLIN